MRRKVEFAYDEPVFVTLRFPQGLQIDSAFDPREVQYLFSADEGTFYLSDTAGALLNARLRSRKIVAGEPITITKRRVANVNSERPITEYIPCHGQEVETFPPSCTGCGQIAGLCICEPAAAGQPVID